MLDVYVKTKQAGKVRREYISAWIFGLLSERYHDEGLETYFNGSGVKAHTFDFNPFSITEEGRMEKVQIRGIEPIERKIESVLEGKREVRWGKYEGTIEVVEKRSYEPKSVFELQSPLIMRVSDKRVKGKEDEFYQTVTPEMDKKMWEEMVVESVKRKAEKIYGKDVVEGDLRGFEVLESREVRAELRIKGEKMVYRSTLGMLKVDADPFWLEFIQRVGLGNRNPYGFGVVG